MDISLCSPQIRLLFIYLFYKSRESSLNLSILLSRKFRLESIDILLQQIIYI